MPKLLDPKTVVTPAAKPAPVAKAKKPAAPVKEEIAQEPAKVLYPELGIRLRYDGAEAYDALLNKVPTAVKDGLPIQFGGPITEAEAKAALGWESEDEFKARANEDMPADGFAVGPDGRKVAFSTFTDCQGKRVVCWNNTNNRAFTHGWAMRMGQEVLTRKWAGPLIYPGETVNGDTIVISRTGQVEQGNHRLIGLIFACQLWRKHPEKWAAGWPIQPVIEGLIVVGVSDSPAIVGTMDNTKPRTDEDALFTGEMFRAYDPVAKKELSRMLAKATDLLWRRMGADVSTTDGKVYRTPSMLTEFRDHHPRLHGDCLEHLFKLNNDGRAISKLRLSPGNCAALMYLMAQSGTEDVGAYHTSPTEKSLDMARFAKAKDFWYFLAKGKLPKVNAALQTLVDEETDRTLEKHYTLAKAWNAFLADADMKDANLELERTGDASNKLTEHPTFGGVDVGEKPPKQPDPEVGDEEVVDEAKAEIRKNQEISAKAKIERARKVKKGEALTLTERLDQLHEDHGEEKLFLFRVPSNNGTFIYKAWGTDAPILASALGIGFKAKAGQDGLAMAEFAGKDLVAKLEKLAGQGRAVAVVESLVGGAIKVSTAEEHLVALNTPPADAAATPATNGGKGKKGGLKGGTGK